MIIHSSTIIFTLLSTFSFAILGYAEYAIQKGWPIGTMFTADSSLIKIASIIAIPGSALSASYLAVWWSGIVVIVAGFISALILTNILRVYIQPVSIIGLVICWYVGITILAQA